MESLHDYKGRTQERDSEKGLGKGTQKRDSQKGLRKGKAEGGKQKRASRRGEAPVIRKGAKGPYIGRRPC